MPTYPYRCLKCNHEFDAVQSILDQPLKTCPRESCLGEVIRLIARTSFVLNGGGWAKDGY